jgi:phthiodiolone/phenolphthiodiolone dimycocerosates ketoreductase
VKGTWPQIWIASHGPRMLRATGRYADAWFPVAIFSPERYADGLQQVQTAADNANRDPHSIIAANTQFVVTERSAGEVEQALDSVAVRAYALLLPSSEWAEHGVRHPMGDDFTGFQDILPQLLDEATALSHIASVPPSLMRRCLLSGTPDEILDQLAAYRDQGVQYPALLNMSTIQPKLSRGLSTALPFMRILRGIRKM